MPTNNCRYNVHTHIAVCPQLTAKAEISPLTVLLFNLQTQPDCSFQLPSKLAAHIAASAVSQFMLFFYSVREFPVTTTKKKCWVFLILIRLGDRKIHMWCRIRRKNMAGWWVCCPQLEMLSAINSYNRCQVAKLGCLGCRIFKSALSISGLLRLTNFDFSFFSVEGVCTWDKNHWIYIIV